MNMEERILVHKEVQKLYKDPRHLMQRAWDLCISGSPKPSGIQYDMLMYITKYAEKLSMIQAFRGCGKSYVAALAAIWFLIQNPDIQVMIVSAAKDKATENATFIHSLLAQIPELNHMQPRPDQRNSMLKFDISLAKPSQSASVFCAGVTGQIEGKRADIILADDIEVEKNSGTVEKRDWLYNRTNEFISILKADSENFQTKIIALGTPQVQESIYSTLSSQSGYDCRIYPMQRPSDSDLIEKYNGNIAPFVLSHTKNEGDFLEGTHFSKEECEYKKAKSRPLYYQLHFMLDPSLSDEFKYPLKVKDLIIRDNDKEVCPEKLIWASSPDLMLNIPCFGFNSDRFYKPMKEIGEYVKYDTAVMAIDISGHGADETGYACVGMKNGYLYVTDIGGIKSGYSEDTLRKLALIAKENNVSKVIMESNFGGGMGSQLLRPILNKIYPVHIEDIHNTKQKELRIIDTLEPIMNRHRLVMDKQCISRDYQTNDRKPEYSFIYQLAHITRDRGSLKHDDCIDALAMACSFWTQRMNIDVDEAIEWDWFEKELRKMEEDEMGNHAPKWESFYD